MPLSKEQQENIEAFLQDKAEDAGTQLTIETFIELLYANWDEIIQPVRMAKRTKRRALRALRQERNKQDADRPGLDAEIAALDAELNP
jgi:hypothetical protein